MARIIRLQKFEEKGRPGVSVPELMLVKDVGISGDRHGDGGEKQISILPASIRSWMEETPEKGLCFRRYKENISLDLPEEVHLQAGDRLTCGNVEVTITGISKKCFPECALFSERKPCKLAGKGVYGKVTRSGSLGVGEEMSLNSSCEE